MRKKGLIAAAAVALTVFILYNFMIAKNGIRHDYKEAIPWYRTKIIEAGKEAEKILEEQGVEKKLGYTHTLWKLQKQILTEKYHIEWKTPAEMNPQIMFD